MGELSEDIEAFLNAKIGSVDHLRILLLLYHSPYKEWDSWGVSSALYLRPDVAVAELAQLQARGLLSVNENGGRLYRYEPATEEIAQMVMKLAQIDQERPVSLINMIYSVAKGQVKPFADAFKIKKEDS